MSDVNPQSDHGCGPNRARRRSREPATEIALWADAQLIAGLAEGLHTALAEVYERHGTSALWLARRLRGRDVADDIVQDVCLRLWDRPGSFDPARGSLRAFLMMQTHGRAVALIRTDTARRNRENVIAVDQRSHRSAVGDEALAHLAGQQAWGLLAGLAAVERKAIVLAYFGGHTYQQVAVLLAQPEAIIKNRVRSGLTRLRRQMSTDNADSRPCHSGTP